MLAHDAPETVHHIMGKISLPEYLDCMGSGKGWVEDVTAWHITTRDRLPAILKNGLNTGACGEWMSSRNERPEAVYMFCARSVVAANVPALLDNPADAIVLRVIIPAKHTGKLHIDNIYNMSIDVADMCSVQYRGSIPAAWITTEG